MIARLPIIVKDPEVSEDKGIEPTEWYRIKSESFFLNGPVSPRVAVLDLDVATGDLRPGAVFQQPPQPGKDGRYLIADPGNLSVYDITQVSVFGTVLKTMEMFEEKDALGRRLVWAFEGPQLLVVPRAGEWANAFYERESRSLQFFYFTAPDTGATILTAHSQDIVAHETAHAILDGIAPDLYHAISPQSLAIHEAVADLTALLASCRSRGLARRVLDQTNGSIQNSSAFSGLAEQFGNARDRNRPYLRDLLNNATLDPDASPNPSDPRDPRLVKRTEPHDLSEVLSGAMYTVLVQLHESLKDEYAVSWKAKESLVEAAESEPDAENKTDDISALVEESQPPASGGGLEELTPEERSKARYSASGKALAIATERFKRSLYRGLDYLPPGEVSFADFGRAVIAADQASHPQSSSQREWICDELLRRGVVQDREELSVATNVPSAAVAELDLALLVESDWAAYEFATRNRALLGIPDSTPFRVRPRLDVTKTYYHRDGKRNVRECIFKVSWSESESNDVGHGLPPARQVTVGTMLAIDWESRTVRARLTSDRAGALRADRDGFLIRLVEDGVLRVGEEAFGPDGQLLCGAVRAETLGDTMKVRGAARMLHITEA